MGQKLLIKLVNLGGPPVPTGPPASNKGIWGGAGVVSGGPPKILELHYSATVFQHCGHARLTVTGRTALTAVACAGWRARGRSPASRSRLRWRWRWTRGAATRGEGGGQETRAA